MIHTAQAADASMGCSQKLVATIALPSSASLGTELLQFTVPCVGRCAYAKPFVDARMATYTMLPWQARGVPNEVPHLYLPKGANMLRPFRVCAARMGSARAAATMPLTPAVRAVTFQAPSTSRSPKHQCMPATRCSTCNPSIFSPTRYALLNNIEH